MLRPPDQVDCCVKSSPLCAPDVGSCAAQASNRPYDLRGSVGCDDGGGDNGPHKHRNNKPDSHHLGLDPVAGEIAQVPGEFAQVRGKFAQVRGEFAQVRGEFAQVRGEFASSSRKSAKVRESPR